MGESSGEFLRTHARKERGKKKATMKRLTERGRFERIMDLARYETEKKKGRRERRGTSGRAPEKEKERGLEGDRKRRGELQAGEGGQNGGSGGGLIRRPAIGCQNKK